MPALVKTIADFNTTLALKVVAGDTTATLTSATDDDGVALPTGTYGFTIDRGNSSKEYITCTLTSTALTNVKTVSRASGAETTGFARGHRKGAEVIISDYVAIKSIQDVLESGYASAPTISTTNQLATKGYADALSYVGAPDASTTAKGIVEMATYTEIDADDDSGSTTAPLSIGPGQLALSKYGTSLATLIAFAGVVVPFAGSTAPIGWLLCDGSAVSRSTYATLFAVTSTTYGSGNGSTTFNLPDLRGRVAVGKSADTEFDTLGETGGAKTHTLTTPEIPSHSHAFQGGGSVIGNPNTGASTPSSGSSIVTAYTSTDVAGGGGAHNNLQPYITLNYIIKI